MTREAAERYAARGWTPIPIPPRQKAPDFLRWQRVTREKALELFVAADSNVGILLGSASSGLVDIDLDCPEAVELAPLFLPPTATFGRASKPRSHWIYVAAGCATEKFVYDTGKLDDKGRAIRATLLELRSDGAQTIFPPSVHPSGEAIAFDDQAEPTEVAADELVERVRAFGAACLLIREGFSREVAVRAALDLDVAIVEGLPVRVADPVRRWFGVAAPAPSSPAKPAPLSETVADAIARWNVDHRREYPRHSAECPVCGDSASFGHLPDDPQRWYCFSTDHPDGVGVKGAQGYHGDALDLEAHARGCKPIDVLRRDSYLAPPRRPPPAPTRSSSPSPVPSSPASAAAAAAVAEPAPSPAPEPEVVPIDRGRRVYHNNSYLTAVQIIEANDRNVLGEGARLEYDEMADRVTLNRKPLERRFTGGVTPNGVPKGLKISPGDVRRALNQVARDRPYHPVREYLNSLTWDKVERLNAVCEDILGAPRTELNQALIRKWAVSAVARAMRPGCKVDMALILVGKQGRGKSTFFKVLTGEDTSWFIDTVMDVSTAKAQMTLRRCWIYEWAELEVMKRARDINAIKAWATSQVDNYVPQYGHNAVDVPRGFVVVGSVNPKDGFLTDDENRRWWTITVGDEPVDLTLLRAQRDQLWAEAMAIYRAWDGAWSTCPWVLTPEEAAALVEVQKEHLESDAWDSLVSGWIAGRVIDFTTADVLTEAVKKPIGMWSKPDEHRVNAIFRKLAESGVIRQVKVKGTRYWRKV
jgi:cell division septation protein DedD